MNLPVNITRPKGTKRFLFSIRINGKKLNKSFPYAEYGDEKEALQAAIKFKEEVYEKNGLTDKGRGSKSSIAGVSRTSPIRDGKDYAYWQAIWTDENGKQHTKRFSVVKHGEVKAKILAISTRKDALKAIEEGADPHFIQPITKYTKLWRYMDFTKFLSMLEDSAIFLSRADKFEDPYEGVIPKGNINLRKFVKSKSTSDNMEPPIAADKTKVMICCWHMSSCESAAMWKPFGQANESICITTKYAKLKNQLVKGSHIDLVQYVDHKNAGVPEGNIYYPYMFKRKSFEHEKEVRVLIDSDVIKQDDMLLMSEFGYKNKVDLNKLIDEVYVDPSATEWFFSLVKMIVLRYGLKVKVVKSPLLSTPESANNALH